MDELLRALKYRAWHRGTREADMMIGGFFDAHHAAWDAHERALFAALLAETDARLAALADAADGISLGRFRARDLVIGAGVRSSTMSTVSMRCGQASRALSTSQTRC